MRRRAARSEAEPVDPPETVSPTEPSTVATAPEMGARSVVSLSALRACASWICACSTAAFADARSPAFGGAVLTALPTTVFCCCSFADATWFSALCTDCVFFSFVLPMFALADCTLVWS